MPLSEITLSNRLEELKPANDEGTAAQRFVSAWESYFSAASVMGVPVVPGRLRGAALEALRAQLVGWSQANQAAAKIQAAIQAFWGIVALQAATTWVLTPPVAVVGVTPPVGIGGVGLLLVGVFEANTRGQMTLEAASRSTAAVLHAAQIGGMALVAPSPPGPGAVPII